MAEVVTSPPEASRSERRRLGRRSRFLLAYALLALILGTAAAVFAALVMRPERAEPRTKETAWSLWRPQADGMARVEEIANFVGRRYRLPSGDQLVAVKGGPLALEDVTISAIAVRSAGQGGGEDIAVQRVENGVVYTMCGLGKRCSIAQGKPSEERGRLVRREALELALYTFAYMKDVDTVVAFLPPPAGAETTFLLYFRRSDFEELLARPLRETLPETEAPLATAIDSAEARVVDALTLPRVFGFALQQLQDGTLLLVLSPPTPTGDD